MLIKKLWKNYNLQKFKYQRTKTKNKEKMISNPQSSNDPSVNQQIQIE